jgi:hypothetical protein
LKERHIAIGIPLQLRIAVVSQHLPHRPHQAQAAVGPEFWLAFHDINSYKAKNGKFEAPFSAFTTLILGLALLFFPIDREWSRTEHGVDKPQSLAHYPPIWKGLLAVAVLAGIGNWFAIARQHPMHPWELIDLNFKTEDPLEFQLTAPPHVG